MRLVTVLFPVRNLCSPHSSTNQSKAQPTTSECLSEGIRAEFKQASGSHRVAIDMRDALIISKSVRISNTVTANLAHFKLVQCDSIPSVTVLITPTLHDCCAAAGAGTIQ